MWEKTNNWGPTCFLLYHKTYRFVSTDIPVSAVKVPESNAQVLITIVCDTSSTVGNYYVSDLHNIAANQSEDLCII